MKINEIIDNKLSKQGVTEVAGDVNSKERYHFLYPHVPLDMHTDHEYNKLSDNDLQAVKSHQRELANKLGKPGAKEQGDIASHIQINRARSQYDQEQAHRRKVLDAEKIKRQARDAKRKQQSQQGVAEAFAYSGQISDPEERARISDIKELLGVFGTSPGSLRRARHFDRVGLLKATPKQKELLHRMTDEEGNIKPRIGPEISDF